MLSDRMTPTMTIKQVILLRFWRAKKIDPPFQSHLFHNVMGKQCITWRCNNTTKVGFFVGTRWKMGKQLACLCQIHPKIYWLPMTLITTYSSVKQLDDCSYRSTERLQFSLGARKLLQVNLTCWRVSCLCFGLISTYIFSSRDLLNHSRGRTNPLNTL